MSRTVPQGDLGPIDVEFRDQLGAFITDPNRARLIGMSYALPLSGHIGVSEISGEPAFGYRTDQVSLLLSEGELLRLLRLELEPDEVKALIERHGIFHEVHDDFYAPDTYEALQPMSERDDDEPQRERVR